MNLSIIGTGLLGASVALAAKKNIAGVFICCCDKSAKVGEKALSFGVCDKFTDNPAECSKDADIIVMASPIFTFKDLFYKLKDSVKQGCVITDTGSTKTMPARWAKSIFNDKNIFIGSHPIAGCERSGIENAKAQMLEGAKCIVATDEETDKKQLDTVINFWQSIGCTVLTMSTQKHDKLYGILSHLPHACAAALVNTASETDLSLAGSGFRDATRISAGPSDIWEDIFLSNAENISGGIDKMIIALNELKTAINDRSREKISTFLNNAREKRQKI